MMAKPSAAITVKVIEAAPMLELLDPARITVRNVREAKPDREFIESIRELGNVQPIAVLRTPDGELVLRFGLQRLQGCIETGRKVLAMVVDGTTGTDEAEIERIFLQLAENDRRKDLTTAERAGAVQELFSLGATAAAITRKTGLGKSDIAAARATAASETARTLAAQYPVDLAQAAVLAEFDDDPKTAERLAKTARDTPAQLAHKAQEARDARKEDAAIAAHADGLAARGIRSTTIRPHYDNAIGDWADAEGIKLTPETHKDCPGNVVYLQVWNYPKVEEAWYCAGPREHGHRKRLLGGDVEPTREEAAAERKRVMDGNKAWRSATAVRQQWIRDVVLARNSVPAGAVSFIARTVALPDSYLVRTMTGIGGGRHKMARGWLGVEDDEYAGSRHTTHLADLVDGSSELRALVITLALIIGSYEQHAADPGTWRTPSRAVAQYLTTLGGWGYDLADVERQVIADVVKQEADRAAVVQQDEATAAGHETANPDNDSSEGFSYLSCGHSIWDGVIREAGEPADCPSHGSVTVIGEEQWMSEYGDEPDAGGVFVGRAVREGDESDSAPEDAKAAGTAG